MDFEFKRRSRICSVSEKELAPSEKYFSVLIDQDGEIVRREISSSEWNGPPENCISWWRSRIPELDPNKFFWAPDNVIIDYFERFQAIEDKKIEQYVLALLLIQKRLFRLENTSTDDEGNELMYVGCAKRGTKYQVPVETPEDSQVDAIQNEMVNLLFSDEPFEQELDESFEEELSEDSSSQIDSSDSGTETAIES